MSNLSSPKGQTSNIYVTGLGNAERIFFLSSRFMIATDFFKYLQLLGVSLQG